MTRDEEYYQQIVDDLMEKHMNAIAERNGQACDHLTIRTPYLPCPHPDCSRKYSGLESL
jgi:hypothetical protein